MTTEIIGRIDYSYTEYKIKIFKVLNRGVARFFYIVLTLDNIIPLLNFIKQASLSPKPAYPFR